MIKRYKVILWDFDGVILDSMQIRDEGFKHVLKSFPSEEVDELMAFHRENGGLSRYVKFRFFYEKVLEKDISKSEVQELADRFSEYMIDKLVDRELLIEETVKFIKNNYTDYSMHIVSGSDQTELRSICKELGIDRYFKTIHGSPTPKKELVKMIITDYNYPKKNVVLIGDSINDFEAAEDNDINFLGFNNISLKKRISYYIKSFECDNINLGD